MAEGLSPEIEGAKEFVMKSSEIVSSDRKKERVENYFGAVDDKVKSIYDLLSPNNESDFQKMYPSGEFGTATHLYRWNDKIKSQITELFNYCHDNIDTAMVIFRENPGETIKKINHGLKKFKSNFNSLDAILDRYNHMKKVQIPGTPENNKFIQDQYDSFRGSDVQISGREKEALAILLKRADDPRYFVTMQSRIDVNKNVEKFDENKNVIKGEKKLIYLEGWQAAFLEMKKEGIPIELVYSKKFLEQLSKSRTGK